MCVKGRTSREGGGTSGGIWGLQGEAGEGDMSPATIHYLPSPIPSRTKQIWPALENAYPSGGPRSEGTLRRQAAAVLAANGASLWADGAGTRRPLTAGRAGRVRGAVSGGALNGGIGAALSGWLFYLVTRLVLK